MEDKIISIGIPCWRNHHLFPSVLSAIYASANYARRQYDNIPGYEIIIYSDDSPDNIYVHTIEYWFPEKTIPPGCVAIKTINSCEKVSLLAKWRKIYESMADNSLGLVTCDMDDFMPAGRLYETYQAFSEGYDFVQYGECAVLSFYKGNDGKLAYDTAIYKNKNPEKSLGVFWAIAKKSGFVFPKGDADCGIGGRVWNAFKPENVNVLEYDVYDCSGFITAGANTVSKSRAECVKKHISPYEKPIREIRLENNDFCSIVRNVFRWKVFCGDSFYYLDLALADMGIKPGIADI